MAALLRCSMTKPISSGIRRGGSLGSLFKLCLSSIYCIYSSLLCTFSCTSSLCCLFCPYACFLWSYSVALLYSQQCCSKKPKSKTKPTTAKRHLTKLKLRYCSLVSREVMSRCKREKRLPKQSRITSFMLKPTVDLRRALKCSQLMYLAICRRMRQTPQRV